MCALSRTLLTQIKVEQKNLPHCVCCYLTAALAFYLICFADAANIARALQTIPSPEAIKLCKMH
jgi:hypothetical protein